MKKPCHFLAVLFAVFVLLGGEPQRLAAVQNGGVAGALINQPSDFIALASGFGSLGPSTDYVNNFHRRAARLGAKEPPSRSALPARLCENLRVFLRTKNRSAAVRALAERTKSNKEDAEKTERSI